LRRKGKEMVREVGCDAFEALELLGAEREVVPAWKEDILDEISRFLKGQSSWYHEHPVLGKAIAQRRCKLLKEQEQFKERFRFRRAINLIEAKQEKESRQ
jgi:leucyl-tRNA synthetase